MSLKPLPLFVLPLVAAASTAQAADIGQVALPPEPPPIFDDDLWHVHVEGGPVFSPSGITTDPADKFGVVDDRGRYVGAVIRHLFHPGWSWQIAGTATWMRDLRLRDPDVRLTSRLEFQTIDADIGIHPTNDIHQRFFAGLRALHSKDMLRLVIPFDLSRSQGEMWLFGPRGGVSWETPIGSPTFAFLTEFSASALFGHATVFFDLPYDTVDMSGPRSVFNVEGQAAFVWRPATAIEFVVGYRAQQWWGLRQGTEVNTFAVDASVDTDKFLHGPFVRLGLDF